ncbi:MAG: hypothetical protein V4735_01755 [Pseudomonadota bacterium]
MYEGGGREHHHAVRIAVVEEQISGLREQQRAHHDAAQKRFDRMESKLDALTAMMDRGKGAYAASIALAAAFGAVVIEGVGILTSFFHK